MRRWRWMRRNEEELVRPDIAWSQQRLDEREMTHNGRTFRAWHVETEDEQGRMLEALVSPELPPLGLYSVETPELSMQLSDWGLDAGSAITGQPLGLTRWILRVMRTGGPDQND